MLSPPLVTADGRRAIADYGERAAICVSAACLAHCLLLPIVLVLLPSLTIARAIPETFHLWALAVAVPSAFVALVLGWRRHRVIAPVLSGAAGLLLLAMGALLFDETGWEVPLTVAGSLTLAAAHLVNWRLRHRTECDC